MKWTEVPSSPGPAAAGLLHLRTQGGDSWASFFTQPRAEETGPTEQRFTLFLACGASAECRCCTACPRVCHGSLGAVRSYESSCCEHMCLSFGHKGCSGLICCVIGYMLLVS